MSNFSSCNTISQLLEFHGTKPNIGKQGYKFAYHAHNSVILSRMRKYVCQDELKSYNQVEVGTVEPDVRTNLGILVILRTSHGYLNLVYKYCHFHVIP